ncbi:MAG TPA: hemolysin III family protein [Thermotogota bacterium]|nr:hemolysin III family protein [Thermotogota bacterium]HRW92707.1 hemolysin III family protein [Thermotogota bacterium]
MKNNEERFSTGEEISHAVSHGAGALLSVAALVLLIVFSAIKGNAWHVVSTTIYGVSLFTLYLASTIYHALTNPRLKGIFELFDHSAIYLLIAGTYTPFALVTLKGGLGWTIFGVIWGLAALGILFKFFFLHRFKILSTFIYIGMGWMVVFAFRPLVDSLHPIGVLFLILGGASYTGGAFFYMFPKFKYHHFIWHLFVLGGSILHFFAVFFYVIPPQ